MRKQTGRMGDTCWRDCDKCGHAVEGHPAQTEMTCRFYREDQDHATGIGCNEICSEQSRR